MTEAHASLTTPMSSTTSMPWIPPTWISSSALWMDSDQHSTSRVTRETIRDRTTQHHDPPFLPRPHPTRTCEEWRRETVLLKVLHGILSQYSTMALTLPYLAATPILLHERPTRMPHLYSTAPQLVPLRLSQQWLGRRARSRLGQVIHMACIHKTPL